MLTSFLLRSFTAKEAWMQSGAATDVALDPVAPVPVHQGGGRYEEERVSRQVSLQVGVHPAMNARQTGKTKATGDFWAA